MSEHKHEKIAKNSVVEVLTACSCWKQMMNFQAYMKSEERSKTTYKMQSVHRTKIHYFSGEAHFFLILGVSETFSLKKKKALCLLVSPCLSIHGPRVRHHSGIAWQANPETFKNLENATQKLKIKSTGEIFKIKVTLKRLRTLMYINDKMMKSLI